MMSVLSWLKTNQDLLMWTAGGGGVLAIILLVPPLRRFFYKLVVLTLTPLRGYTIEAFARWQREKVLVKDTDDDGNTSQHQYIRSRRNYLNDTIDLWLSVNVTPSEILELRTALGWFFWRDESRCQDVVQIGKGKVRLIGAGYYPRLDKFRPTETVVSRELKKVPVGIYLGRSARRKHVVVSLQDTSFATCFGRAGAGKSLFGWWCITSLLLLDGADITVFDVSGVDFLEFAGIPSCTVITDLAALKLAVERLEEEASRRLKAMQRVGIESKTKITDVMRYAAATGEVLKHQVLVIDECQEIFGKRTAGSKEEIDLRQQIANKIATITSKYRKCGVTVVLLGTAHTSGELTSLPFSNIGIRLCGSLGHKESSRSYLQGSELAANDALRSGRLCLLSKETGPEPVIIQLPIGLKPKTKEQTKKTKTKV